MNSTTQLGYQVVPDWEQLPAGIVHADVSDVAVDANARVYLVTRSDSRVIVYESDGTFVREWGADIFTKGAHGISVASDGSVYVVDQFDHVVRKFTPEGEQLLILGTPGVASDTGIDWAIPTHIERTKSTKRGGPPFNNPTNVSVSATGEIYVSDGYGNARVHKFSADGELLLSWGEPGSGAGEFRIVHDVWIDDEGGRVLVADRENDRVQLFTPEGEHLTTWQSQKPCGLAMHDGLTYVAETRIEPGTWSFTRGEIRELEWAQVSIYDETGKVLERFGHGESFPEDMAKPGVFTSAHGIAVDSRGAVYVAETTYTSCVRKGTVPADCHTIQKFEPAS
jgi:DNA-binding beta-propeller fold protein YncE